MRWTLLLALLPTLALAQSPTTSSAPRSEDLGTVTGHITCTDTQRPARNATVSLIATKILSDDPQVLDFFHRDAIGPTHTDLNGDYAIPGVPPGQYYLRVDLYGYATPLKQFTAAELKAPTPEIQQRIQREIQVVNVTSNSALVADVTLRRSGSITGRIMYDDGSPVITTSIAVARRDTSGHFGEAVPIGYASGGHGEYEIVSLSPGEYIVQVKLNATEQQVQSVNYGDGKSRNKLVETFVLSLPVYSGSAFRSKDAAVIKVEDAQETANVDVTIPISRLRELSGTLLAKDGHAINEGRVDLLFADTQEEFIGVAAHSDGSFRFPYVPDGNYTIVVTEARDRTQVEIPISTGPVSGFSILNQTAHTYGTLKQPLTVHTDIPSLNLTLPDKPTPPNNSTDNK